MRRGLLSWNRDEVPEAALEARITRCQAAMRDAGFDALLVYTSFPRPAASSYLTHFVPYWSQGILAVLPDGLPVLLVSLSKRVGDWIRSTAHVADLVHSPDLGRAAAALIGERIGGTARVGIVEYSRLPGGISRSLLAEGRDMAIDDASALFRAVRGPADAVEVALGELAAALAERAMAAGVATGASDCGAMIAAIERTARLAGAEEVQVLVAADLARDATLRRIEGACDLGDRFAVRVSLAHKGHWVRLGQSITRDGSVPAGWSTARGRFEAALTSIGDGGDPGAWGGDGIRRWSVEGCIGTLPLQPLAGGDIDGADGPAPGAMVTASAEIESADGPFLACEPIVLALDPGGSARRLAPPAAR